MLQLLVLVFEFTIWNLFGLHLLLQVLHQGNLLSEGEDDTLVIDWLSVFEIDLVFEFKDFIQDFLLLVVQLNYLRLVVGFHGRSLLLRAGFDFNNLISIQSCEVTELVLVLLFYFF